MPLFFISSLDIYANTSDQLVYYVNANSLQSTYILFGLVSDHIFPVKLFNLPMVWLACCHSGNYTGCHSQFNWAIFQLVYIVIFITCAEKARKIDKIVTLTIYDLAKYFHLSQGEAAKKVGVSSGICRMPEWKLYKLMSLNFLDACAIIHRMLFDSSMQVNQKVNQKVARSTQTFQGQSEGPGQLDVVSKKK